MKQFILRAIGICIAPLLFTSCWVGIENKIEPDVEVDERLLGVWKIVHLAPDEILDPEAGRYDEDFGVYEVLVIGKAEDGALKALGVDSFENSGPTIIGNFSAKTLDHQDRHFLLGEMLPRDDKPDPDGKPPFYFVMEYAFNESGDLFLWGIHDGLFDEEYYDVPQLAHRIERNKMGGESVTITATPDELLDFLVDPRVSPHLLNCGKYRKMILPEGNSAPITNSLP